jgi:putative alpha-1,2-mannosidase
MKRRISLQSYGCFLYTVVLSLLASIPTHSLSAADRGFAEVDPFIGTGGEGHTFPGAVMPFGMVQLSPDTQLKSRKEAYGWAAGYRYEDHTIFGFSHTLRYRPFRPR